MTTYTTNAAFVENLELVKTDKNGSKHYVDHKCPKCGGTGRIDYYYHVDNGVCFKCGGSGRYDSIVVLRTQEYSKKLQEKFEAKQRKLAPEFNKTFYKSNGFDEEGNTWVVLGNTFDIKDELKAKGATFNYALGWHFDSEVAEYDLAMFSAQELLSFNDFGRVFNYSDKAMEIVKSKREEYEAANKPETKYYGNVGDKIELRLRRTGAFLVDGYYGSSYINKMIDSEGNIFIWKTGIMVDEVVILKGTIKEHNEFRGEKQTVLTRCKVREVA